MVPLSNSAEIVFIAVTIANKKNPNPPKPTLEPITKSGFGSTDGPPKALTMWPIANDKVVRANATISIPRNFFFRMFQSISYLTTARNFAVQLVWPTLILEPPFFCVCVRQEDP